MYYPGGVQYVTVQPPAQPVAAAPQPQYVEIRPPAPVIAQAPAVIQAPARAIPAVDAQGVPQVTDGNQHFYVRNLDNTYEQKPFNDIQLRCQPGVWTKHQQTGYPYFICQGA